jgi:hypothetical protein
MPQAFSFSLTRGAGIAQRPKNKIATIKAIISVQLRDQPRVRSGILDRLAALTVTDHLIEQANGQGAYVRNIAVTEIVQNRLFDWLDHPVGRVTGSKAWPSVLRVLEKAACADTETVAAALKRLL